MHKNKTKNNYRTILIFIRICKKKKKRNIFFRFDVVPVPSTNSLKHALQSILRHRVIMSNFRWLPISILITTSSSSSVVDKEKSDIK